MFCCYSFWFFLQTSASCKRYIRESKRTRDLYTSYFTHVDSSYEGRTLTAVCLPVFRKIFLNVSFLVTSTVRAFTTYVRPGLEYCSVVWNPMLKKDIEILGKVQRRFTKRIPWLKYLTYCQRLGRLKLDTGGLELRRVRSDLIFT